jgi:hypothetical protein
MAECASFDNINFDSSVTQPIKRWSDELLAPSTASRRIHYGKKRLVIHDFARVGPDALVRGGRAKLATNFLNLQPS